uniref:Uncharacterized protein n=1 Tax=Romanomermis culicivorax TaxID=13658 RepID=A0A915IZE0_ROMCU
MPAACRSTSSTQDNNTPTQKRKELFQCIKCRSSISEKSKSIHCHYCENWITTKYAGNDDASYALLSKLD